MNDILITITLAILGSNGLFVLIQFLINRHDAKRGRLSKVEKTLNDITEQLKVAERDNLRTQLLILISDYPDEKQEIMMLAEHYFGPPINGDWYMSSVFNLWITKMGITEPIWFDKDK